MTVSNLKAINDRYITEERRKAVIRDIDVPIKGHKPKNFDETKFLTRWH